MTEYGGMMAGERWRRLTEMEGTGWGWKDDRVIFRVFCFLFFEIIGVVGGRWGLMKH